ncbi:hypothetical protein Dimus_000324 [Dionaea muscipula]
MMRMKTKLTALSPKSSPTSAAASPTPAAGGAESGTVDWELRPCGMLVQKRLDSDQNSAPARTIRVRVKYGTIYHEISISSQATFGNHLFLCVLNGLIAQMMMMMMMRVLLWFWECAGELKKKLQGATGLHHQDQKLFYKDKQRDSNAYLDIVGVKDKSKIVLVEDPISQEKRYLEMRKNSKMEKASKSISDVSLEVDRLSGQVSALEAVISKGGKVAEKEVLNLTELLMNELIKLDAIVVSDGEVKLRRKIQVRRVQKYVETLDMLKVKNSMAMSNGGGQVPNQNQQKQSNGHYINESHTSDGHTSNGHRPSPIHQEKPRHSIGHSPLRPPRPPPQPHQQTEARRHSASAAVVTTQWEIFDSGPEPPLIPIITSSEPPLIPIISSTETSLIPLSPTSDSAWARATANANTSNHNLNWEFFE